MPVTRTKKIIIIYQRNITEITEFKMDFTKYSILFVWLKKYPNLFTNNLKI